MFIPLSSLAKVSLGYKSLQNDFYYLNRPTIETFGIEDEYLKPVHMLKEFDSASFAQSPPTQTWLFYCRKREADLRGTGAQRYIDAVADRPANQKKQASKPQTIREALSAQGGNIWYAPKAQPAAHHIWLRKALDGVYSPFLFSQAEIVDQRCNSVEPVEGIGWEELAAILTTTLFSYAVEVNGAASMGAGALEAPTTKLRDYPVLDLNKLDRQQRSDLLLHARAVWRTSPVDWSAHKPAIPKALEEFDSWALDIIGSATSAARLHADLKDASDERRGLAKDKTKTRKTKREDNIAAVADTAVERIRTRFNSRRLPEDFVSPEALDTTIYIAPEDVHSIEMTPFIGETEVVVRRIDGSSLFSGVWNDATAETIVRAVLAGRSAFQIASDRVEANQANEAMIGWLVKLERDIEVAVSNSSLGTGYEEMLRNEIIKRLAVDRALFSLRLPRQLTVQVRQT